jgi:hypothetical protein
LRPCAIAGAARLEAATAPAAVVAAAVVKNSRRFKFFDAGCLGDLPDFFMD